MESIRDYAVSHKKRLRFIALAAALFVVSTLTINYFVIGSYSKYILESSSELNEKLQEESIVGVVFGGGIENGKPRPLLKDRLNVAAALVQSLWVRKLIVSGDNRFVDYNEPEVMKKYLVEEKGINPDLIQLDNAGRSTYESCERAEKIFSLGKVLLISEETHLPRAIYTCRSFGIETYGYRSDGQSAAGLQVGQRFREIMARTKASLNIYIIGEKTVLGPKIEI